MDMIAVCLAGSRVSPNAIAAWMIPRQVDSWLNFSTKAAAYLFIWRFCERGV